MKKIFLLVNFCAGITFCFSQTDRIFLEFTPVFDSANLEIGKKYFSNNDSISIEHFRFYVSDIIFLKNGIAYKPKENFFLIDCENKLQFVVDLGEIFEFDSIRFNIGIDSLTNVSGAMGDDLDPANGMYWTWQSGYINFKLEGTSTKCKTRKNLFQFHIGGYLHPNATLQTITLPAKNKFRIEIKVDIEKLLSQIDLAATNTVMSPGEDAVKISNQYKEIFSINNE